MYKLLTPREEAENFISGMTERQQRTTTLDLVEKSIKQDRERARAAALSRIGRRFVTADLLDLREKGEEIRGHLDNIIKNWGQAGSEGFLIYGNVGTGKTHALSAIWRYLAELDPKLCGYLEAYTSFIQEIRDEFSSGSYTDDFSVWRSVTGHGLRNSFVILDDVGASRLTDFEIEKLYLVLDKRLNDYLPTIITTNVDVENLAESFGSRIASRLDLLTKVNMRGIDVRKHLKKEK